MERKASFAPVVTPGTRVLILGSLPGEASLAARRYYAHPTNQFWRLAEAVIETELTVLAYPERLAALGRAGVGLWDVIGSARREGSLDAAIRDAAGNPLAELTARLPALRAVAFNGGTAARLGRPLLAGGTARLVALPSSSAAHTLPFATKRERWLALREFLA